MAQYGADAVGTIYSTALESLHGSLIARLGGGVTGAMHQFLDDRARDASRAVLNQVGYQYVGLPGFPRGVLTESQIACAITPHTDERLALVLPALSKAVVNLANISSHLEGLPNLRTLKDCAPFAQGYVLCRLTFAISQEDAGASGFHSFPYRRGGQVPPPYLHRTAVHPSRECGVLGCRECIETYSIPPLEVLGCALDDGRIDNCCDPVFCRGFQIMPAIPKPQFVKAITDNVLLASTSSGRLVVADITVPLGIFEKIDRAATSQTTSNKKPPPHLYARIPTILDSAVEDFDVPSHIKTWMLASARLLYLASTVHALKPTGTVLTVVDTQGICRQPTSPTAQVEQAVEDAKQAFEDRYGDMTLALPLRPATEMTGLRPKCGLLFVPDEDAFTAYLSADLAASAGAVVTGPNLFGKNHPIDTKDIQTMLSAVTRHFYAVEAELQVNEDGSNSYLFRLAKDGPAKPLPELERTLSDVWSVVTEATRVGLAEGYFSADFDLENRPSSMSQEEYEDGLLEACVQADFDVGAAVDKIVGSLFSKAGEDGDRARFISVPGCHGTEKLHQVRTCGPVKMIEAVHKFFLNHTHIKGLDDTGKKLAFGSFMRQAGKHHMGFSFDKKANDRTWTSTHWDAMVRGYTQWCVDTQWCDWQATHVYTSTETTAQVKARMLHAFGRFVFDTFALYLFSGIGPTGLFNRQMALAEEGTIVRCIYGEKAYDRWLDNLRRPSVDHNPEWLSIWHYGRKFVHNFSDGLMAACLNEGDDKTGFFSLVRTVVVPNEKGKAEEVSEVMEWQELLRRIVTCAAEQCGVAYEVALVPQQATNTGRKAVLEFCSVVAAIDKDGDGPARLVPKPVKALGKMAWSATRVVNFLADEDGVFTAVAEDETHARFCATKALSIASINRDSPFVGPLFLKLAEFFIRRCKDNAMTLYHERAPEKRGLEEWKETTYTTLREMSEAVESTIPCDMTAKDCYAAAIAWQMDCPALKAVEPAAIIHSLQELHMQVLGLEFDRDNVYDPVYVFESLEWGVLRRAVFTLAARKYAKLAAEARKPEVSPEDKVAAVRRALCGADTAWGGGRAAKNDDKQQQRGGRPEPKSSSSAKPTGKGTGTAPAAEPSGKAKGKGKGGKSDAADAPAKGDKGKGKAKGKSVSYATHPDAPARSGGAKGPGKR